MKVNKWYTIESMNPASRMSKGLLSKPIFWLCFTNQYRLLREARFDVETRRPLLMREAGFMDSMVYHLLPVGINFSIDKCIVLHARQVRVSKNTLTTLLAFILWVEQRICWDAIGNQPIQKEWSFLWRIWAEWWHIHTLFFFQESSLKII